MKKLFILLLAFAATSSFGQTANGKTPGNVVDTTKKQNRDTSLRVVYVNRNKPERQPAFFLNGKYVKDQGLLGSLNPKWIESVDVLKRDTLIENSSYNGLVYIRTKDGYAPKYISLTDLKNKYTEFKGKMVVFMIDGNFVNANYDNYIIDENNLLTIIVDKLQMEKEKIDLGLIKLLTQSEENIKKRNTLILRGKDVSLNK